MLLAVTMSSTDTLNLSAMDASVSPDWTVYVKPPLAGAAVVGVGAGAAVVGAGGGAAVGVGGCTGAGTGAKVCTVGAEDVVVDVVVSDDSSSPPPPKQPARTNAKTAAAPKKMHLPNLRRFITRNVSTSDTGNAK